MLTEREVTNKKVSHVKLPPPSSKQKFKNGAQKRISCQISGHTVPKADVNCVVKKQRYSGCSSHSCTHMFEFQVSRPGPVMMLPGKQSASPSPQSSVLFTSSHLQLFNTLLNTSLLLDTLLPSEQTNIIL
jgi:hypothetical protein